MAARVGGDTQSGGPEVLLYSGSTLFTIGGGAEHGGSAVIGESFLLDIASGTTWAFPGMYIGLNLNAIVLSLKLSKRGLRMADKSCSGPSVASRGLWSTARMRLGGPVETSCTCQDPKH